MQKTNQSDQSQPSHLARRTFLKSSGAIAAAGLLAPASLTGATAEPPAPAQPHLLPSRNLGRTGHKVALFSLGGQGALERPHNEAVAIPIIERALDLGVNYCDTSSIYGGPDRWSERYFGAVMKARRKETFLATKTKDRTRDGSMRMIERSLHLLNTDHVDLWQLHDIGTLDDVNLCFGKGGAMEALSQCKEQGIVKNLGVTGHHRPDSLMECIHRYPFDTVLMALNAADAHQHPFSAELLPLAVEKQMGIIGMKVPARGRILASWTPPPVDRQQHSWEGLADVTTKPGTLTIREAMYWTLSQPVSTVIIGCDTVPQLEENIAIARAFTPLSHREQTDLTARVEPVAHQSLFFKNFDRNNS